VPRDEALHVFFRGSADDRQLTVDEIAQRANSLPSDALALVTCNWQICAPAGHGAQVGRSLPSSWKGRKPGTVGR
jgi:hypothetical protein